MEKEQNGERERESQIEREREREIFLDLDIWYFINQQMEFGTHLIHPLAVNTHTLGAVSN